MINYTQRISGRKSIRDEIKQDIIPEIKSISPEHKNDDENYITESVKDFLQNTTLHGLKYTADDNLAAFERIFFVLSFIFVVIISAYFINNVFIKYNDSPIIISTDPKPTFTSKIPFPAVTICSLNQARKSRANNFTKNSVNYSSLMSLCGSYSNDSLASMLTTWRTFKSVILDVSMPCKDLLTYCEFGGKTDNCIEMFIPTLTDDGLCCTFNAVDPKFLLQNYTYDDQLADSIHHSNGSEPIDWTPEKGYPNNLPEDFYPRIAQGTGRQKGLSLLLDVSKNEYYCSSSKGYGFKVLIHSPIEQPKISNFGFLITAGKETRVNVKPVLNTANLNIRPIRESVRNCLFTDEGNLTFFRSYSRKNCESECEARKVYDRCKCILYYMPRIAIDIVICRPSKFQCAKKVLTNIQSHSNKLSCEDCLPGCFELSYEYSTSSNQISSDNFTTSDVIPNFYSNSDIDDISILHLYYSSNLLRSQIKDQIVGFTELLSNIGGLLGLFMGFSIFSIIEMIYFVTLRPYCTYKRNLKHQRNLEKDEIFKQPLILGNKQTWFVDSSGKFDSSITQQKFKMSTKLQPNLKNKSFLDKFKNKFQKNEKIYPYCE